MAIYTWPSAVPLGNFSLSLISNALIHSSPYSGAVQAQARRGSRWRASINMQGLTEDDLPTMQAFLVRLDGPLNQFRWIPPNYSRRGNGGGTPLLNGAASAGDKSISIDGASLSVTNWLRVGDFFQIGNELKMVVGSDVDTDGTGAATIEFGPQLHDDFPNNEPLDIDSPLGLFFLPNKEAGWLQRDKVDNVISVEALEYISV